MAVNRNRVYGKRLLKLAEFLDALPRKNFDYGTWCEKDVSCGTKACALGWACTMPQFRRLGARLIVTGTFNGVTYLDPGLEDDPDAYANGVAKHLFGLSDVETDELFYPETLHNPLSQSSTPKAVAKHIRKFVARKYPEATK